MKAIVSWTRKLQTLLNLEGFSKIIFYHRESDMQAKLISFLGKYIYIKEG